MQDGIRESLWEQKWSLPDQENYCKNTFPFHFDYFCMNLEINSIHIPPFQQLLEQFEKWCMLMEMGNSRNMHQFLWVVSPTNGRKIVY